MNILVIGEEVNFNECCSKFGTEHIYAWENEPEDIRQKIENSFIVFDFTIDQHPDRFSNYCQPENAVVFVNTVNTTLKKLAGNQKPAGNVFGFCGLPTLLNRTLLEVSILKDEDEPPLKKICSQLNTEYRIVADKVGFITPRIVCMIINEAFYALEEEIASAADIDRAMKLGTNYPYGPLEWSKKIGLRNVCNLLNAVYKETRDERYKISSLLAAEALKSDTI
jgi:3-hydroxybutyryl-CoA dehydrogenase